MLAKNCNFIYQHVYFVLFQCFCYIWRSYRLTSYGVLMLVKVDSLCRKTWQFFLCNSVQEGEAQ